MMDGHSLMMNMAAFHEPVASREGGLPRWSTEESCTHSPRSSSMAPTRKLFSMAAAGRGGSNQQTSPGPGEMKSI
jgi:hypothetical protein